MIASGPFYDHGSFVATPLPLPPVVAGTPPPISVPQIARVAARMHGIDAAVVLSIIKAESDFRSDAVSPKGAVGVMQLMPETAAELGYDPTVPEENIQAGTRYMSWLVDRYKHRRNGLSLAIAAYNAGPGNVDRYRGVPPFAETRSYVKRVMAYYKEYRRLAERAPGTMAKSLRRAELAD